MLYSSASRHQTINQSKESHQSSPDFQIHYNPQNQIQKNNLSSSNQTQSPIPSKIEIIRSESSSDGIELLSTEKPVNPALQSLQSSQTVMPSPIDKMNPGSFLSISNKIPHDKPDHLNSFITAEQAGVIEDRIRLMIRDALRLEEEKIELRKDVDEIFRTEKQAGSDNSGSCEGDEAGEDDHIRVSDSVETKKSGDGSELDYTPEARALVKGLKEDLEVEMMNDNLGPKDQNKEDEVEEVEGSFLQRGSIFREDMYLLGCIRATEARLLGNQLNQDKSPPTFFEMRMNEKLTDKKNAEVIEQKYYELIDLPENLGPVIIQLEVQEKCLAQDQNSTAQNPPHVIEIIEDEVDEEIDISSSRETSKNILRTKIHSRLNSINTIPNYFQAEDSSSKNKAVRELASKIRKIQVCSEVKAHSEEKRDVFDMIYFPNKSINKEVAPQTSMSHKKTTIFDEIQSKFINNKISKLIENSDSPSTEKTNQYLGIKDYGSISFPNSFGQDKARRGRLNDDTQFEIGDEAKYINSVLKEVEIGGSVTVRDSNDKVYSSEGKLVEEEPINIPDESPIRNVKRRTVNSRSKDSVEDSSIDARDIEYRELEFNEVKDLGSFEKHRQNRTFSIDKKTWYQVPSRSESNNRDKIIDSKALSQIKLPQFFFGSSNLRQIEQEEKEVHNKKTVSKSVPHSLTQSLLYTIHINAHPPKKITSRVISKHHKSSFTLPIRIHDSKEMANKWTSTDEDTERLKSGNLKSGKRVVETSAKSSAFRVKYNETQALRFLLEKYMKEENNESRRKKEVKKRKNRKASISVDNWNQVKKCLLVLKKQYEHNMK